MKVSAPNHAQQKTMHLPNGKKIYMFLQQVMSEYNHTYILFWQNGKQQQAIFPLQEIKPLMKH